MISGLLVILIKVHPENLDHTKGETFNLTEKEEKREIPKGREGGMLYVNNEFECFIRGSKQEKTV
jgi:hypothetical protein